MPSFNKVVLVGNLTRDIELRYTPGGAAVCDLGLAVNRTWFDKQANEKREEVTFVDVTAWGRTAEIAAEYLSKGRAVLIEGRLSLDQWEDKQSGQKRSKLKVVCESLTMLGGNQQQQAYGEESQDHQANSYYQNNQQPQQPQPQQHYQQHEPQQGYSNNNYNDNDTPF